MNGQESLWAWLGIAVAVEAVGGALVVISNGDEVWLLAGWVVLSLGGLVAFICAVGIGVTAGMLRYDHLKARRR